jgi:hypothetical protein
MHSEAVLLRGAGTSVGTATTAAASVKLISDNSQCTATAGGSGCCDSDATAQNDNPISRPGSPPVSPQLNQRSNVMNLNNNSNNSSGTHAQNDSLILEDGQLRSLRDSNQDLSACVGGGGGGAPLSPRPWYKRSIARDEKRCAPTTMGTSSGKKKSKSPDNLPEIQPGREGITVKENFEEKYSYFTRKVPAYFFLFFRFIITNLDYVEFGRKY